MLPDHLGSVRQVVDADGNVVQSTSYTPFGEVMESEGSRQSVFGFTGEQTDETGLMYLRARYYAPGVGRFITVDPWRGDMTKPMSSNSWLYVYANPVNMIDPSGYYGHPVCRRLTTTTVAPGIGSWDCQAVSNIASLREDFLSSASRHNHPETNMDNSAFAALVASLIVGERRIGNIPPLSDSRNIFSQGMEDLAAKLGFTVSGGYIKDAIQELDISRFIRYVNNDLNEDEQRATVGIGNMWLETAANIWRGQACPSPLLEAPCIPIPPLTMSSRDNMSGHEMPIINPFGISWDCGVSISGSYYCGYEKRTEAESYVMMTRQLINHRINIEYVSANLEAGAWRVLEQCVQPTAYNSAVWHLRGVQTNKEINDIKWNSGAAGWTLDNMSTALQVLQVQSSWNLSLEPQYWENK
jgi:RHS repeat-associated protein